MPCAKYELDFLLALCPPNIDPSSLSVMVAFAVGGLLGDTLFHLLPEIFLGEDAPDHARFILVQPNKNLLLGVAIMVGFLAFVAMDKGLRIATGGQGGHDHSHAHKNNGSESEKEAAATTSGVDSAITTSELKNRKSVPFKGLVNLASNVPSVDNDLLLKFQGHDEPRRSSIWLRAVFEEDADSEITQMAFYRAYEACFNEYRTTPSTLLPAPELIKRVSVVFPDAEPQFYPGPEGSDKNFTVKGIRPRGKAMDLQEWESGQALERSGTKVTGKEASQSIRLSAYLNLIADFTHNITDGLALSSSFYASPTLGATTTVAVFFHEIPHEVGDFALLIQSGFSKKAAMSAQFVTALGAFLGTCLGIAVQELGKTSPNDSKSGVRDTGLAGTGLGWGDMLLPFTAGTFLYVGTVAVIPELLETGPNKSEEMRKTMMQFTAMALGAGIMLA